MSATVLTCIPQYDMFILVFPFKYLCLHIKYFTTLKDYFRIMTDRLYLFVYLAINVSIYLYIYLSLFIGLIISIVDLSICLTIYILHMHIIIYYWNSLQIVQNAAARVLTRSSKYDHITPILQSLHWLPIKFRISYKILLLAYKALNDLAPAYLTNLLSRYNPTRSLR